MVDPTEADLDAEPAATDARPHAEPLQASALEKEDVKAEAEPSSSASKHAEEHFETPAKKKARVDREPSVTPPNVLVNAFGGQHVRSSGCVCCERPRQPGQRGRLCPPCLVHCKKILGHQRIDDLMANQKAKDEVRALTEAQQQKDEEDSKVDQREMMARLEKILKSVPRLEKCLERLETLSKDVD